MWYSWVAIRVSGRERGRADPGNGTGEDWKAEQG